MPKTKTGWCFAAILAIVAMLALVFLSLQVYVGEV
jgi:hypothetical protein